MDTRDSGRIEVAMKNAAEGMLPKIMELMHDGVQALMREH